MRLVIILAVAASATASSPLTKRQIQTEAVCDSSFAWASNSKQQTPCLVAAYVNGACGTNTYRVVKLPPNSRYDRPNATTANACTCSWASYNLLSACTACQDQPQSVPDWDDWITDCSSFVSDKTYFPSNITLPSGTAIPYWAATDPRQWPDHHFDVTTAKNIANQGHADLVPVQSDGTKKSSTPAGAIAGGVVGGLVIIGCAAALVIFFLLRSRKKQVARTSMVSMTMSPPPGGYSTPRREPHLRSLSNDSNKSLTSAGYLTHVPTPPSVMMTHLSTTGHTQHGRTSSLSSFPLFTHGHSPSLYSSPSPPPHSTSPEHPHRESLNPENIISPFPLSTSPTSRPSEKSGSLGGRVPIYDSPTLPPPGIESLSTDHNPPRPRLNPPAYSRYEEGSAPSSSQSQSIDVPLTSSGRREKGHRIGSPEKDSVDNTSSWDAATQLGSDNVQSASGAGISAIDGIIGRMGLDLDGTVAGTAGGHTVATGSSGYLQGRSRNGCLNPNSSLG